MSVIDPNDECELTTLGEASGDDSSDAALVMDHDFPSVPAATADLIRNAERHRLAYLLEKDGDAVVGYLSDPRDAVSLIAYLLRLKANRFANQ